MSQQQSPRDRKRSKAAQASTVRREQGKAEAVKIRPPGSVHTPKGWRRERWETEEEGLSD